MSFRVGDEVAILPFKSAAPDQTIALGIVRRIGEVFIELDDGRMYATIGLHGLNTKGTIESVTDAHRAAIQERAAV